ncbi:MAG: DUF222 domain-containing protein [Acidimicrobiales bacterium]
MSTSSFSVSGHPVMAALDAVDEALDKAATGDVWSLSDDDLQATVVACEVLAARQAALSLRLVREADARDLGRQLGATSTAAWLRARLRLRAGEAKMRVELANRLRVGEPAGGPVDFAANVATTAGSRSMPSTAAALADGAVSVDHAGVIARTMVELPGGLSTEQERAAEADLAGYARRFDPVTLANLGRHLIHTLDTDTLAEREERAYRRRLLHLVDLGDGPDLRPGRHRERRRGALGAGPAGRAEPGRRRHPGPAHRRAADGRRTGRTRPPQPRRR